MTTRRFTQQHGYIAALLVLALVCAIPLIHAHSVQRDWSDKHDTSGWAWVGNHSFSVQDGNVKARSEHQCGILNNNTNDISIVVGYDHKVQRNGSVVAEDNYSDTLTVELGQYFTTNDVPGHYVRSTPTPFNPEAANTFQPYTKLSYTGQASAQATHEVISL